MSVRVQQEDFSLAEELEGFGAGAGAIVSFTGIVRDLAETPLIAMEIEHYPAMTKAAIEEIVGVANARWALNDCKVVHRFGRLEPGAQIMMVATASAHRVAAFEAAEFLMDYLKSRAPFWKREITKEGAHWVEAKAIDEDALKRW